MKRASHVLSIFALFTFALLLSACSSLLPESTAVDGFPPLTERITFDSFGYAIAYPEGWMASTRAPVTIISELAADQENAFTDEDVPIEGLGVAFDHRDLSFMRRLGLPAEPTLQDLFELNQGFFNWPETAETEETELFGAPALSVKTREGEDWTYAFMGFVDDQAFLLTLRAPSEEALTDFLPLWERMRASIEPVDPPGG